MLSRSRITRNLNLSLYIAIFVTYCRTLKYLLCLFGPSFNFCYCVTNNRLHFPLHLSLKHFWHTSFISLAVRHSMSSSACILQGSPVYLVLLIDCAASNWDPEQRNINQWYVELVRGLSTIALTPLLDPEQLQF